MAKDITIAVTGQNPDGTLNVRQVGGDTGNPFAQSTTAMVPYGQNTGIAAPSQSGGFKARIGNSEVTFASEADFLKADRELRDMMGQTGGAPALGAPRLGGGTLGGFQTWLRTGADAANAVGGILAARGIQRKIDDVDYALDEQRSALSDLDQLAAAGKYPELIPILRRMALAERDATVSHLGAMEDQILALDIQTGAGVAGALSNFVSGRENPTSSNGSGLGTALAVGGVGLGIGLLASRNNNNDDRDRRWRR